MSFAAGVELKTGDKVEIEFTPAYSGLPIRVCAVARNGNGYKYGAEFVAVEQLRTTRNCLIARKLADTVVLLLSFLLPSY